MSTEEPTPPSPSEAAPTSAPHSANRSKWSLAYERGFQRGQLSRVERGVHWWTGMTDEGVRWEYDRWDWCIRILFLIAGVLLGFGGERLLHL